jgi:hypothetical protein
MVQIYGTAALGAVISVYRFRSVTGAAETFMVSRFFSGITPEEKSAAKWAAAILLLSSK